jgi:hypothetical protein
MTSLLKAWWGDAATEENDYCFDYLPRIDADHSIYSVFDRMLDSKVKGFFAIGQNPAVGSANSKLHRLAMANLAAYRNELQRCHDIRFIQGDAAAFTLPPEPLVLYFYNPFRGEVMRRALRNIERSAAEHPRPISVLHLWPRRETRALFAASPAFVEAEDRPHVAVFRT